MRTSFIAIFGLFASTIAVPASLSSRQTAVCSGAEGTAQCCDVNVLGIADLDCESPPTTPTSVEDFVQICAAIGKIDMCCLLPILDQGLICTVP